MFLDGNGPSFLVNKVDRPTVRESKTVLHSGFHAGDSWFQVLDSSLCQWNLDYGFQVRISAIPELYSGFWSPEFRIPQTKISRIPETRFPAYIRWGRGRPWIAHCMKQGTLRCHDGDDNENAKKAIDWISKTTTLHVHLAFLYISLPPLRDYDGKMPNFTFYGGRKQAKAKFCLFLNLNIMWFLGIRLKKSSLAFDNWSINEFQ